MNRDYTRTIFDDIDWTSVPNAAIQCPTTINGTGVLIDMSHPVDFIDKKGKIVLNETGDFDLASTLAWTLAMSIDNPDTAPEGDYTDDQFANAGFWLGNNIIRYNIHQVMYKAGMDVEVRNSDVIQAASLDRALNGNLEYYRAQSQRLWNFLTGDDTAMAGVTSNRTEVTRAIVAVANHRDTEEKHSWFTGRQAINGSMTKKHLNVAGSHVEALALFMLRAGHDIWHYLSDQTLRSLSYLVCGMVPYRVNDRGDDPDVYTHTDGETDEDKYGVLITDSHEVGYRAAGPVMLEDFEFLGDEHDEISVLAVIDVGQAAKDRFPFGTLGVSSLITGCAMISAMLNNISSKVVLEGVDVLVASINSVRNVPKDNNITRVMIMALRVALGDSIRLAFGYCDACPELKAMANSYDSLVNFSKQEPVPVAMGATLAARIRELTADPDAVAEAIKTTFKSVSTAINSLVECAQINTTTLNLRVPETPEISIYRNLTQVQEETQRREASAQMEAI